MDNPIVVAILFSVIVGIIMVIVNVVSALKHPEKYQKMTDDAYKKINNAKESVKSNTISWEDAKKQAAAELEMEKQMKAAKKEAKKNRK